MITFAFVLAFITQSQATTAVSPSTTSAPNTPTALIPQVWVDLKTNTFHTLGCKLITKEMRRLPRSVAKMRGISPARECMQSDAEAARLWNLELQKGVTAATRGGGFMGGGKIDSSLPSATSEVAASRRASSRPALQPSPPRTEAGVTRNEVMAASDFYGVERIIAAKCGSEWPGDPHMISYCIEKQTAAVSILKQGRPFGAGEQRWNTFRVSCSREWPNDYSMRVYCEQKAMR